MAYLEANLNTREFLPEQVFLRPERRPLLDYYSIEDEIDFVREANIPVEDKKFYLQEEVVKFLSEHVGRVPYTKVSFLLKPDGLDYRGINMTSSYRRAAEEAGPGSREEADKEGIEKIHQELLLGQSSMAIQLSPPKIDNYSFAFCYLLEGEHIDLYALRYPEMLGSIGRSSFILSILSKEQNHINPNSFLRTPIFKENSQKDAVFENLLFILDISNDDIEYSLTFEKALRNSLSALIEEYSSFILSLAENSDPEIFKEAQKRVVALFNGAKEVKKNLDGHYRKGIDFSSTVYGNTSSSVTALIRLDPNPMVAGNCPSTRAKSSPFGAFELTTSLTKGTTLENFFSSNQTLECVTCPFCKETVDAQIESTDSGKIIKCPKCHKSASYS